MIGNFSLQSGEKLEFELFFQASKKRRIDLGRIEVSYEKLAVPENEGRELGKLNIDLTIDSKFEVINSHCHGFEIIDTKFNNTMKANHNS